MIEKLGARLIAPGRSRPQPPCRVRHQQGEHVLRPVSALPRDPPCPLQHRRRSGQHPHRIARHLPAVQSVIRPRPRHEHCLQPRGRTPQPKVPVLARPHSLVKQSHARERRPPHHRAVRLKPVHAQQCRQQVIKGLHGFCRPPTSQRLSEIRHLTRNQIYARMRRQVLSVMSQLVVAEQIIRIQKLHELPGGVPQPRVPRRRQPRVHLANHLCPPAGQLIQHRPRSVRRSIIDVNGLNRGPALPLDARHGLLQKPPLVVHRHDHGDGRSISAGITSHASSIGTFMPRISPDGLRPIPGGSVRSSPKTG